MGVKKLPTCEPKPKVASSTPRPDPTIQKAEIERMKKLLSEKIKDPELARKAAIIISEMLGKK
jgi:hypothetical protein